MASAAAELERRAFAEELILLNLSFWRQVRSGALRKLGANVLYYGDRFEQAIDATREMKMDILLSAQDAFLEARSSLVRQPTNKPLVSEFMCRIDGVHPTVLSLLVDAEKKRALWRQACCCFERRVKRWPAVERVYTQYTKSRPLSSPPLMEQDFYAPTLQIRDNILAGRTITRKDLGRVMPALR